ncbi:hypothetical protein [Streptococcus ruminantium]|uniref:hypothetical protein n=1 Tax=Streptococcus ruminantium TaxID=1917441 RepID=UPI001D14ECAA|nr:hypothetical protein [Streptococcus ruminantium]BDD43336.1 hypothetical protein GUT189_16690 [Streptococcus ruminantium]
MYKTLFERLTAEELAIVYILLELLLKTVFEDTPPEGNETYQGEFQHYDYANSILGDCITEAVEMYRYKCGNDAEFRYYDILKRPIVTDTRNH